MKKLIIVSIFVLFIGCLNIFAQRGGNRGPGPNRAGNPNIQNRNAGPQNRANRAGQRGNNNRQRRGGRIFRGLDLSGEQRQQIRDINTAARENGTDRETVINQIRGVLNDEQTQIFNERLERARERRQRRQERRQQRQQQQQQQQQNDGNPPPPPPLPTPST